MQNKKKKVIVAMSGGVDSSVTAYLLKEQGYDVTGMFMKNWSETKDDEGVCTWRKDRDDALRVATVLGIPFETVDFEKEYHENVFDYMVREYQKARTPNPDVICNREIKFGLFLKHALSLGADFIATGHYARIKKTKIKNEKTGKTKEVFNLLKGVDKNKDQSYFLCLLNQKQLSHTLFPVGHLKKPEVREIAKSAGLPVADKKGSQGICFVGKVYMQDFLQKKIKPHSGEIRTADGRIIGVHPGVEFFTIGQRHGINVGGGNPFFVVERDLKNNILVVTDNKKDPRLFSDSVWIKNMHWISGITPEFPFNCKAQIRYHSVDKKVILSAKNNKILCKFEKPVWAASPGQFVVFYQGSVCLGGGEIERLEGRS